MSEQKKVTLVWNDAGFFIFPQDPLSARKFGYFLTELMELTQEEIRKKIIGAVQKVNETKESSGFPRLERYSFSVGTYGVVREELPNEGDYYRVVEVKKRNQAIAKTLLCCHEPFLGVSCEDRPYYYEGQCNCGNCMAYRELTKGELKK